MIVEEAGRFRTIRNPKEDEEALKKQLALLSEEEREALKILLHEITDPSSENGTKLLDLIGNAEYKRTPVDMETFVKDPYFLGKTCAGTPKQVMDDLKAIFAGGYNEAILTGSIGWGKSFAASIGVCRVIYELSCMVNPQESFGLAPRSNISVLVLSINETLAIKVAFEYVATKLRDSAYFADHFPFKLMKKELRFPNNIWVAARATSDTSALGLNPISAILDEMNFMPRPVKSARNLPGEQPYDQAETIYNSIKMRMKSRYEKRGNLPGILFLVSSKQTVDHFIERRVRECKEDPSVYVMDYALWDVRPGNYDIENGFWILCGSETVPSKILDDVEYFTIKDNPPDGTSLVRVPSEFRADFERNLEKAIRDLAGRATAAIFPFIQQREKIQEAVDPTRVHPFSSMQFDTSKGGRFLWEKMIQPTPERLPGGEIRHHLKPIVSPLAVRHVHIDPSLRGDCAGFCMAHVFGWKDVRRRTDEGHEYVERAPLYFLDVVLQVVPPIGGEIILGEVRRLVYDLSDHGYTITSVSQDSFQSADGLQKLSQKGYNAQLVSVDISIDPYDNLKTALYENRVFMYDYEPLKAELRKLEYNSKKRKVDHPPRGSKDIADAVAGCLFTLSQSHINMPLPIVASSSMSQMLWADPGYAAIVGGTSHLIDTPPSLGLANALPPFFQGGSGLADWTEGGGGWFSPE